MSDLSAMMKSKSTKGSHPMTELDLEQFAQIILDRYTPFAFKCECNGTHPECADARTATHTQYDTVLRIAKYISNYNPNL
jgi:hypothetical protein